MPLQRVSFVVPTGEIEAVLHLPDTTTIGGCAVLHGFGGHPEQPHIVATCAALAEAGIAALRFAYRASQPPKMTLDTALADTAGAIRLLKAHPDVPERLGVVGFSFGGAVAAVTAGRDARIRSASSSSTSCVTRSIAWMRRSFGPIHSTSAPRVRSSSLIVSTSRIRGTFDSSTGSLVSRHAAMIGSAAFLFPAARM